MFSNNSSLLWPQDVVMCGLVKRSAKACRAFVSVASISRRALSDQAVASNLEMRTKILYGIGRRSQEDLATHLEGWRFFSSFPGIFLMSL